MKGLVLKIERGSLDDGPGLRTTVFLKGCPLRCRWCHNPESQSSRPELQYFAQRCVACGACFRACPQGAISLDGGRPVIDRQACRACGTCTMVCPGQALALAGEWMESDVVLATILRDRGYFASSGGGMTISGGEPLSQAAFCRELLEKCHQAGIDTAVETAGLATTATVQALAPLVDLWLFDYKLTGPDRHLDLTGARPEPILANLEFLAGQGSHIVLRCPIIPGVNDNQAHIQAIAALLDRHPAILKAELLPYHDLGLDKAERIGQPALVERYRMMDTTDRQRVREWIVQTGQDRIEADWTSNPEA